MTDISPADRLAKARDIITGYTGRPLRIMEVCGTHTHEIFRLGIRSLLPENIKLISGPGCPVCVTPTDFIDEAIYLALEKNVTVATFGDLVRVPGSEMNLAAARAKGADVQVVYAPMDAALYAKEHPEKQIVFLSVGFETTTPASCLALTQAADDGLTNFSLLTANKTMDAAYRAMEGSCDCYLYPGHVCAITGTAAIEKLTADNISGVVAGFTAEDILTALAVAVVRAQENKPFFVNCYSRVVKPAGNVAAQKITAKYFTAADVEWRGLGVMPASGLKLRDEFAAYDARKKYAVPNIKGRSNPGCRCGDILQGKCLPADCPLFGKVCHPENPVGACMVSNEGACSAYYQYGGKF